MIALAIVSVQATIQTRIALRHNDDDYRWPFVNSEAWSAAWAVVGWRFSLFCIYGFISTL